MRKIAVRINNEVVFSMVMMNAFLIISDNWSAPNVFTKSMFLLEHTAVTFAP
jgi:hypothetical protein